MKNIKRVTGSILLWAILLGTYSCKEAKPTQNDPKSKVESNTSKEMTKVPEPSSENNLEFNSKNMQESYQHYNHIKTALVNGDVAEVKSGSTMLMDISEDEALRSAVKTIADATDISAQRTAFAAVSLQMEELFRQNLSSGTLYKQFCPMALNNKGAYWFSEVKEIRNPYFGDQMLKCGSVVATIN